MPSVPIWFTLAATLGAAVLGILGVVTGHLISAWREDRREKSRARVEFERDQIKYRHEKSLWWIEQRASVYEQILTLVNECKTDIDQVYADNEDRINLDSPEYGKIESRIDDQIRPLIERTTLIAPPEVRDQISATHTQLITFLYSVVKHPKLLSLATLDYNDEHPKLHKEIDKMLELMQVDLGITHPR